MKNMRRICRVLLWVGEQDRPVGIPDVCDALDLTYDQAKASLHQLQVKQKLIAFNGPNSTKTYTVNDDYEPADRPKKVPCQSPVAKAAEARLPAAMASAFKFADKKIALLRRLQTRCIDTDADLIDGIIRDYKTISTNASNH